MAGTHRTLEDIDDDTLIVIFSLLSVKSISAMRMTCRRMATISYMRIVWHNAYVQRVLYEGFPFPHRPITSMDALELEHRVRHAIRLGTFWLSPSATPRKLSGFQASSGTGISDVRFLPGHGGDWLVTVSKGIWSMITCWDISSNEQTPSRKVAEWSPKGAIFTGFVVNSDPESEGIIATSVIAGSRHDIQILSIVTEDGGQAAFRTVCSINSPFRPITLQGDLIAFSNDSFETTIMNWRSGAAALLCSSEEPADQNFQYNRCLRVLFAHRSVLIVRARSVELFSQPSLHPPGAPSLSSHPIASHSFGWIDGVSVSPQLPDPHGDAPSIESLSILLRAESDNPWSSDAYTIDLFSIQPNPTYTDDTPASDASTAVSSPPAGPAALPYVFPPVHTMLSTPSVRGFLRCTDVVLGYHGTAIWIQPRPTRGADLTTFDVHASEAQAPERQRTGESLTAAVFAGPLHRRHPNANLGARMLWENADGGGNWNAIDYDEEMGRIAMGSTHGRVTVLALG
ncbi:hypothetical protein B0H21DRAFT_133967 [Amylocystis lapponica]|nr:hypothetical protein B0H21DRAFT_133967 [Amylocystis lapponica]